MVKKDNSALTPNSRDRGGGAGDRIWAAFDGAAYGPTVLSILAVALLFFFVPMFGAFSVGYAAQTGDHLTMTSPGSQSNTTGWWWADLQNNPSHSVGGGPPYWYDAPAQSEGNCELNSLLYSPTFLSHGPYIVPSQPGLNGDFFMDMNNPMIDPYTALTNTDCYTDFDEVMLKMPNELFFYAQNQSLTNFFIRNTQYNGGLLGCTNTPAYIAWGFGSGTTEFRQSFDWWLTVDGERAFGATVTDQLIQAEYNLGTAVLPLYCPTATIDYDLTGPDEWKMRQLSSAATYNEHLNHDFVLHIENATGPAYNPYAGGVASYQYENYRYPWSAWIQQADHNGHTTLGSSSTDYYIRAETDYVETSHYDWFVRGSAMLSAILITLCAVASTPWWNPFQDAIAKWGSGDSL